MSPLELHRIECALADFYGEGEVALWLDRPQRLLGGKKPLDCSAEEVWRLIDQLRSGAYI